MATDKQIAANRLNAQKSTGPRTPEGRAAVRLNGVTHGLTAQTLVLKGESETDFTDLLNSLEAEHDPATPTEEALVVQLAMATWRLRRLYHAEAGFYTYKVEDTADSKKRYNLDDASHMGLISDWNNKTLDTFSRNEGRLERSFYRALHELQRLHKERGTNLASVLPLAPKDEVEQVPDPSSIEINNIPEQSLTTPDAGLVLSSEIGIHKVPEAV